MKDAVRSVHFPSSRGAENGLNASRISGIDSTFNIRLAHIYSTLRRQIAHARIRQPEPVRAHRYTLQRLIRAAVTASQHGMISQHFMLQQSFSVISAWKEHSNLTNESIGLQDQPSIPSRGRPQPGLSQRVSE